MWQHPQENAGVMPRAMTFDTEPGSSHPLGTTTDAGGVNFSIFLESTTEAVQRRSIVILDGVNA
jgi:hypothetical protein